MARQKKGEKTTFNAFMNAQDHAAWKKDYDAQMKAKRYTVGEWDSKKGVRKKPIRK